MTRNTVEPIHRVFAIAFLVISTQACECSQSAEEQTDADDSDTLEDAAAVDSDDAAVEIEKGDAETSVWDGGVEISIDANSNEYDSLKPDSGPPGSLVNDASQPPLTPRPAVTPDTLTPEVLDTFHQETDNPDQPAQTEMQDCGYTMTVDYESQRGLVPVLSPDRGFHEIRYFDQEGRLLLQQSDLFRTEVRYDQRGRPITVWVKSASTMDGLIPAESCIIAIGYKSDGSAEAKLMTEALIGVQDCDYILFDEQLRPIQRAKDESCDGVAEEMIEIHYDLQTGRPVSYSSSTQFASIYEEISWSYADDGREVAAEFTDRDPPNPRPFGPPMDMPGKSSISFTYDDSGRLLSTEADYENDDVIDEYSDYRYDERGSLLRQETYIDDDEIIDLLRANTYSDDGRLLTQTLRNLTPPGMGMYFSGSEFQEVEEATVRTTTYTYNSNNVLIRKETEDEHMNTTVRYAYDALGRLIEQNKSADFHYDVQDGITMYETWTITCKYEIQCDRTTIAESDLHRCELSTPTHHFIFPYRDVPTEAYYSHWDRVDQVKMIPHSSVRTMVGIPWY